MKMTECATVVKLKKVVDGRLENQAIFSIRPSEPYPKCIELVIGAKWEDRDIGRHFTRDQLYNLIEELQEVYEVMEDS